MFVRSFIPLLAALLACADQNTVRVIRPAEVAQHIEVLAADSLKGRGARRPELFTAARYVAKELSLAGVDPLGPEFISTFGLEVRQLSVNRVVLRVDGRDVPFRFGTDVAALYGSKPVGAGELLVMTPSDLAEESAAERVSGRVLLALVSDSSLHGSDRGAALRVARSGEAAGLILGHRHDASEEIQRRADRYGGPLSFNDEGDLVPTIYAGRELTEALLSAASEGGTEVTLEVPWEVVNPGWTPNVAGIVQGSDPALSDERILLVAHLDHLGVRQDSGADSIYNGADDNASGVAALLEIAEALALDRSGLGRSVVVLFTGGEESGLRGAEHFAGASTFDTSAVVAVLNLDMVGRNDPGEIQLVGAGYSDLGLLAAEVMATASALALRPAGGNPDPDLFRRGDHFVFARAGIPALWLFSGFHADYHEPSDESGRVDEDKVARVAELALLLTHSLATAEFRPELTEAGRLALSR